MNSSDKSTTPASASVRRPQFWQVAKRCCQIAGTVDVAFFFLFYALGSPLLAWVNVISVSMYILAYQALARRRNRLAIALIWTEVIVHATLGTLLIGWGSGFHYYLLMFIPALFLSMPLRGALVALVSLWAFYVALDVVMWTVEPLQPISRDALLAVHLFNLSVVFAMFSYLSFFYLKIVSSAQRKLRKMAATDPLTGLFNRRHMLDLAEKELARFQRSRHPIGLLLLDIDHFKAINDSHGHEVGDKVLLEVASAIKQGRAAQPGSDCALGWRGVSGDSAGYQPGAGAGECRAGPAGADATALVFRRPVRRCHHQRGGQRIPGRRWANKRHQPCRQGALPLQG